MKRLLPVIIGLLFMLHSKKTWAIPNSGYKYAPVFAEAERQYNIPPNLLARVAYQESRFRPDIITGQTQSPAGAQGIMQIVPRWHPDAEPLNPTKAIPYAANYLRQLKNQFGTWEKALAAYNWGPGNLQKAINKEPTSWKQFLPKETRDYIGQISSDIQLA